jgi:hypothetical protein
LTLSYVFVNLGSLFYVSLLKTVFMKKMFTLLATSALTFSAMAQVTVTYQVDVTGYIAAGNTVSPNGIRIGGNFGDNGATDAGGTAIASWTPSDATCEMASLGNNIWSIDITYPNANIGGTQLYKFVNGDWGSNEGTDPANTIASGGCGVDDGGGNINRTLTIPQAGTSVCYTWDACAACAASLNEEVISKVIVSPNPVNESAEFTYAINGEKNVTISIFNLAGQEVSTAVVSNTGSAIINTEALNAGSYIYQVKAGYAVKTGKLIKK